MKKIFTILLLTITMLSNAQESVLLRINYKKGAEYLTKMSMNNDLGAMGFMGMNMDMHIKVIDVKDAKFYTEMSFKKITMDVMQGGMTMSYDSSKKEEELDQMGKMLQAQIGPMLGILVASKTDIYGIITDVQVEPEIPNSDQFTNQTNNVVYPKNRLKVGDSWTAEKDEKGMKMNFVYTVKSITKENVMIDITGTVSNGGKVTGNMKIDRNIGIPTFFEMDMDIMANGQKIKSTIKMTTTQI